MADDRRIIIELKNIADQTAAAKTNKVAEDNSELMKKTLRTLINPLGTIETANISKNVIVNQAYQQAKQVVKEVGQYHIYKYFALQENYLAETDYSNIMTGINKVVGFGATVATGAIVGSKYGWFGALAGAAITGVGWGITQQYQTDMKLMQQQISINENNSQSQFQRTRLGLTTGRGVTNQ